MSALSPSQGTPMSVPRPCPAPTDKEGDDALLGIKGAPGLAAHLLTLLRQAAHLGVGLGRGNENTPPPPLITPSCCLQSQHRDAEDTHTHHTSGHCPAALPSGG